MRKANEIVLVRGDRLDLEIPSIKYRDSGDEYTLKSTDKIIMEVKKHSYDKDEKIRKVITTADIVDDKIQIVFIPSETANLEVGTYVYDVRLVMDANHIYTIVRDSDFKIFENVSDIEDDSDSSEAEE